MGLMSFYRFKPVKSSTALSHRLNGMIVLLLPEIYPPSSRPVVSPYGMLFYELRSGVCLNILEELIPD